MIRITNTSSLSDLDLDDLDSIIYCAAKEIAEECDKMGYNVKVESIDRHHHVSPHRGLRRQLFSLSWVYSCKI